MADEEAVVEELPDDWGGLEIQINCIDRHESTLTMLREAQALALRLPGCVVVFQRDGVTFTARL